MAISVRQSVVLIESGSPKYRQYGSGFVFYTTRYATYILTSFQVLKKLERLDRIIADDRPAELISINSCEEYHPAVLKVNRQGIERPYLPMELSDHKNESVHIYGFRDLDYNRRKVVSVRAQLGKKAYCGSQGWDNPVREIKVRGESYRFSNGFVGGPVVNTETGHAIGILMSDHTGQTGFSICLGNLMAFSEIWRFIPRDILKSELPPYGCRRDFRIKFGVVAMTENEARDLSSGRVFGHGGIHTEDYMQFQAAKNTLRLNNLSAYYGGESVHWQPIKGSNSTIRDLIQNVVRRLSDHIGADVGIDTEFIGFESPNHPGIGQTLPNEKGVALLRRPI